MFEVTSLPSRLPLLVGDRNAEMSASGPKHEYRWPSKALRLWR